MASSIGNSLLRLLPLAALGLALAGPNAEASPSAETAIDASPASTVEQSFLWRVDGVQKPSFLFGTIHAGVTASDLPLEVGKSLIASDTFVMETIPTKELLSRTHRSFGMPMDFALASAAKRRNKPVLGLESLRFQMNLMAHLGGGEDMAAMLAEDPNGIAALTNAYRSGELSQIARQTECDDSEVREMLFTRRNFRWANQLSPGLKRGGLFVAVGVGHFPGADGLLQLLRDQGFSPTRVVA